jgi:hypothetical protein
VSQEVGKVSAGAAAGIEHTPAAIEAAAQELIEEIDVDVAERRAQFSRHSSGIGRHPLMISARA